MAAERTMVTERTACVVPALPHEILCHVLDLACGLRELYTASRVCRSWSAAAARARDRRRVLQLVGSHRPARGKMRYPCAIAKVPYTVPGADDFVISEEKRLVHYVTSASSSLLIPHGPPLRSWIKPPRGSTGPSGLAIHAPPVSPNAAARTLELFVSDTGRDVCTHAIAPHGLASGHWPVENEFGGFGTAPGMFIGPADLCVSSSDGLLLVAEVCTISAFHLPSLSFAYKVGSRGSGPGAFRGVSGLDVCNGEVYVCDSLNHRIQVLRADGGSLVRAFGGKGDAPGLFRKPASIAVVDMDAPGIQPAHLAPRQPAHLSPRLAVAARERASRVGVRVIVGETTGKRVQVLSAHGSPLQLVSTLALPPAAIDPHDEEHRGQAMGGAAPPARIACFAVDAARQRVYAANASANARLYVWQLLLPVHVQPQ